MENILFGEIFGKFKVLNITYIFMKGRALKQKNETIIPNDFFYFYEKIEESREFNSKLLEVNSVNKFNPFRYFYSLYEKYLRNRTGLSFYGNEFLKYQNIKTVYKSDKILLVNESVSFSLLLLFFFLKKITKVEISIFLMGLFSKLDIDNKYHKRILNRMLNLYDKFIFVGKGEYDFAEKNFPDWSEKYFFLPFSVDQDFWKSNKNTQNKKEILFLGNDLNRDFEFAYNLGKNMDKYSFIFVSNSFSKYKKYKNIQILDSNWLEGGITDIDIRNIFEKSACTIVPLINTIQPSGQSVSLQSMSMNVPVIITKTKGFWDYDTFENNRNIIFAEKNDIELWESLIENLFKDNSLYGKLIMNAKKTMEDDYNQDKLFKKFLKIISN